MSSDDEVNRELHSAIHTENIAQFKRLLVEHPHLLRNSDGTDYWMRLAALSGSISLMQSLVELGMNVNESSDCVGKDSPFYEPEGPILQAAGKGDLNMVQWLLDHGAKINYVVNGKPRCLPLIAAAGEGHLDVVKVLVEHGADVDSTWDGLNTVTQAEKLGHPEIRDYLLSLKRS